MKTAENAFDAEPEQHGREHQRHLGEQALRIARRTGTGTC